MHESHESEQHINEYIFRSLNAGVTLEPAKGARNRAERRPRRDLFSHLSEREHFSFFRAAHTRHACVAALRSCNENQKFRIRALRAAQHHAILAGNLLRQVAATGESHAADSGNVAGSGPRTKEGK